MLVVLGISAVWGSLEPDYSVVRAIAALATLALLIFLALRAEVWLIALLAVGQTFLKGAFGGEVSRDSPFSIPLLIFGVIFAFLLVARAASKSPDSLRIGVNLKSPGAWGVLLSTVALGMILALGIPRSPMPEYGQEKLVGYFIFNVIPFLLVILFVKRKTDLQRLALALATIGTLATATTASFLQVTHGSPFGWGNLLRFDQEQFLGLQVYGGVWLARRAGLAALSLIALASAARSPKWWVVASAAFCLNAVFVLLSGRGPFIAFCLGMLMMIGLLLRHRLLAMLLVGILSILLLVGLSVFVEPRSSVGPRTIRDSYDPIGLSAEFERYRWRFYESAWNAFLENPVSGVGTGGWRAFYTGPDTTQRSFYPHNLLLEIAAENGLIGLFALSAFLLAAAKMGLAQYRESHSIRRDRVYAAWALSVFTVSFLYSMVSGDLFRNDLLWLSGGLLVALRGSAQTSGDEVTETRFVESEARRVDVPA